MTIAAFRLLPGFRTSMTPSVRARMGWMLIALLPGIAMRVHVSGIDLLAPIMVALSFALPIDALLSRLRGQPLRLSLVDGSAAVTAALFALCLPSGVPWWIVASGVGAALLFGKHVYGGLGRNPFNPAMLGVALVLLGFPAALAAHALDSGSGNSDGWIWVAGADALGGLILLRLRIVRWQIPLAVFAGAAVGAGALWLGDGAIGVRGLLAGNLVLGAFFVASDPVSGCITRRGRWLFGAGIGLSIALLDRYATTAASLPIAVLLMNGAAPWIDRRTQPRRLAEQRHG